ncbi:MAG: HAD hydrolase-like protein [Lachnospiraceae bacterium]|nr:HAD hydrolase-like protein [Lachnospiraceae bacterium]MBR3507980.1 HAD hydrolase-like protein [Lachnospiraceae bacterium]MBR4608552.1 HAD hydrolase-like protein [Lachnospiraceae bacterium]MBR6151254.1 HAD hydrolase-like protein [Lachnospiraceae bacterium]
MAEHKMRYLATRQAGELLPEEEENKATDDESPERAEGQQAEEKSMRDAAMAPTAGYRSKKEKDDIWVKKEYLLFDLDGTLTDPKVGITTCVQYALKTFGIDEPDLDKLEPFIGPPLLDSFKEFYGFDDEKAQAAIEKYRERFRDVGIFENEIYRGVPEMLKKLKQRGLHLGVASSKPTVFVEKILEHFRIKDYFEVVVGSELDGTRSDKAEVVLEALRRFFPNGRVQKHKVFMIGDRKFDVIGAKNVGVESVAVSYGYGDMEELMQAHADYIVRSVEELKRFLLRGYEDMDRDLNNFQKMWILISQFVIFVAMRGFVRNACGVALDAMGIQNVSDDVSTLILGISFIAAGAAIFKVARGIVKRTIQDMYLTHLKKDPNSLYGVLAVMSIALSLGLAMLFNLGGFVKGSEEFQKIAEIQASASLWVALLTYGLIAPIAEELLFRGVIYGYVRKFFDVRTAIIGSAILFGVYHGNMVQALNATILGYFMAYAYEYFGDFKVPIFMHVGMNVLALIIEYSGLGKTGFVCWPVCIVFLVLGIGCAFFLARRKRL